MNIVIISHYIFPKISPRSIRTTELAKEFARQGHTVHLYAKLGNYDYTSFRKKYNINLHDIGKTNFTQTTSSDNTKNSILTRGLTKLLKYWLEFPEIELAFKIKPILKNHKERIDGLITIASPYPIHWGAAWAKYKLNSNFPNIWIADCGDPYFNSEFRVRPFYFKHIEKWFMKYANFITIPIAEAKSAYFQEFHPKIRVIPQGTNMDEFSLVQYEKNNIPTFMYAGRLYKEKREPVKFFNYLNSLESDYKFVIYSSSHHILDKYFKENTKVEIRQTINREKLIPILSSADFLINLKNEATYHSPSKIIDYLAANRPIIDIENNQINFDNFDEYLKGNYSTENYNKDEYDIKYITNKFIKLILNLSA